MRLAAPTSPLWLEAVLSDFNAFLLDHAACERKASGTAMAFLSHYPDRPELVAACAELAVEELDHFRQVVGWILRRGLTLPADRRDAYVRRLTRECRPGASAYFLDRLLVASIVEARGCERLALVASAHPEAPLKDFYRELARSEARHQDLYANLAARYFPEPEVAARLAELLAVEARLVAALPAVPALFSAGVSEGAAPS